MTISQNTAGRLVDVLIDVLGKDRALEVVQRVIQEVQGNASFNNALWRVSRELSAR